MAEYRVAIVLDAQGRAFVGQVNAATGALTNLRQATDQSAGSVGRMAQQTAVMEQRTAGLVNTLRSAAGLITAVLGAAVAREILQTGLALDAVRTKIQGITGDSNRTASEIAFLREVTDRLGVSFRGAAEDYASLLAAARGTELAQYTREIAESVLTAGRAYQLSGEQIRGALTAIEQMISKGTVSAEELRGQLGERLPGAFQIAARAMGVTTQELGKMLERGEVVAADFLPRFARELRNATAAGAELAASKPAAEFERLGNALGDAFEQLSAEPLEAFAEGARELTAALKGLNDAGVPQAIGEGIAFLARNADVALVAIAALTGARGIAGLVAGLGSTPAAVRNAVAGIALLASTSGTATAALAGLRIAGVALFTALGGWVTVAAAAATGLYWLATRETEAEVAAEALDEAIQALNRSTDKNRQSTLDALVAQREKIRQNLEEARSALAAAEANNTLAGQPTAGGLGPAGFAGSRSIGDQAAIAFLRKEVETLLAAMNRSSAAIAKADGSWAKFLGTVEDLPDPLRRVAVALGLIEDAAEEAAPAVGGAGDEFAKAAEQAQDYIDALIQQREVLGLSAAELIRYRAELAAAAAPTKALADEIRRQAEITAEAVEQHEAAEQAVKDHADAQKELQRSAELVSRASVDLLDFEREIAAQLGGPSAQAALDYERALQAVLQIELALMEVGPLTEQQLQRLAALRANLAERYQRDLDDIARANDRVAQEVEQVWEGATRSIGDAFGDFVASGLQDFESFRESLKDIARQIISELVSIFVRDRIIIPIQAQITGVQGGVPGGFGFGGGFGELLGAGLQGAGIGSLIGSTLFGGSPQNQTGGAVGGLAGGVFASTTFGATLIGSALSGAGLGAALGSVVPIVGTIIGSILGSALGQLFENPPEFSAGIDPRHDDRRFTSNLGTFGTNRRGDTPREIAQQWGEAIQQFDDAIYAMVSQLPGGAEHIDAIRLAVSRWNVTLRGDAVSLENVLESRFDAIMAAFDASVQRFVTNAGTLEEQVQRLGEVLTLDALVDSGEAIVPTLDGLMTVLLALQQPGESLIDTYARAAVSTGLYEQALTLAGIETDKTREELVAYAVAAAEATGGLQQAAGLWSAYFEEFYTAEELALMRLEAANAQRNTLLSQLGLQDDISNKDFRAEFEAALPTLSPEELALWLQAGAAIAAANAAHEAYVATLPEEEQALVQTTEASGRAVDALRDLAAELAAAREEYAAFSADLQDQAARLGRSDFFNGLADTQAWTDEMLARADELARAAGMSGAAIEDLTAIMEISAARTAAARARVEGAIGDLVAQLFGTELSRVEDQIALWEQAGQQSAAFVQQQLGGIDQVSQANEQRYQRELQLVQRLHDFVQSLLLDGSLSPLDPAGRLNEAQSQYEALLARAQAGDVDALAELEGAARAYLAEARSFFGSTDAYSDIFASVIGALQGFSLPADPGAGAGGGGGGYVGAGGGGGGGAAPIAPELAELYARRDEILAQQEEAQRREAIQQLIRYLTELAAAGGESVLALADRLQVPLVELVSAMGVNLGELTAETTQTLATLAAQLGVELTELAGAVGVDLGQLADRQSLLNDALEAQIVGLPTASRDALEPIFRQLESTTDPAEQERLLRELEAEANRQPEEIRRLLAPYLEGVDVQTEAQAQLAALGVIEDETLTHTGLLTEMRDLLAQMVPGGGGGGLPPTDGSGGGGGGSGLPGTNSSSIPSYRVGTDYVPADGLAYLHQGEAVLTREQNAARGAGGAGDVVRAIESLRASSLSAWESQRAATERVVAANEQVARRVGELAAEVDMLKLTVSERGR